MTVKDTVNAKAKLGQADALGLVRDASTLIISKGRTVAEFAMKRDRPDDDTLLKHMLGPTGNLRAPTLRKGKMVLVGFCEDAYQRIL